VKSLVFEQGCAALAKVELYPMPLTIGKSRIEALSDGVFAIAMTLLVLKLDVPQVMHHSSNEAMLGQLVGMAPAFIAYVVTFLIAGGFWFLHQLTFHFIRQVDSFLVWVNLIFLLLVALLPFSAGLMTHLFIHPVSQLFYFGNQLAIALLLNLHWQYAKRKALIGGAKPAEMFLLTFRTAQTAAMFAACLIAAFFVPAYSWVPLPVFLLGGFIVERSRKGRSS
jgi:uncharacterized membrane protein